MVYSVMPLFLLSIGASKTTLSLIEGIAESTASLLKVLSGIWSDKIGRNKPFMILGYGLTALITPFYALLTTPLQVLFFRFIERVGKGLRTAPRDSLISRSIGRNAAGRSFGFHKAMDNSGAIVGPLLAFILLFCFPGRFDLVFLAATIPAILGVLTIVLYIREKGLPRETKSEKILLGRLPRKYYALLVIVVVFSLGNSTDALLLVKTSETGIRPSLVPFIYMLFNAASVMLAVPLGRLSDKRGRGGLIVLGFLVYALVYFLFGHFNHIGVFIPAFMLYGAYTAMTDSSLKALITDIIGEGKKGTAFGIYHSVLGITLFPASLMAGLLYDKVNSGAPFYVGAALALLAAVLMVFYKLYYLK